MSTEELLFEQEGPFATVTFNRPEARNALTWAMYERLVEICETVNASVEVRVLILGGAGGKAFAAGTDISQFQTFQTAEDVIGYERHEAIRRLQQHRRAVEDEDLIVQAYMSEDFKEGVAAFLEKRPPVFRGR